MFTTLRLSHDPSRALHTIHLFPAASLEAGILPILSAQVLQEMETALDQIAGLADDDAGLSHVVISSDAPVFALGADLGAVIEHVRRKERSELTQYLRAACRFAHRIHGHLHPRVHTMALVQGTAMGGGFEIALACETLVAERGVKFGLPEIAFGSFAGCGAYSYLARLVGQTTAGRMLVSGNKLTSDQLHDLGVIEHLADQQQGWDTVNAIVDRQRAAGSAVAALKRVRQLVNPVTLQELEDIADIWVDTTMSLPEEHLAVMEQLVRAQGKRVRA